MIWVAIAAVLVLWLAGLLANLGPLVNLLLVAAAILLVAQVVNERDQRARAPLTCYGRGWHGSCMSLP